MDRADVAKINFYTEYNVHNPHDELSYDPVKYFTGTRWKDYPSEHRADIKNALDFINKKKKKCQVWTLNIFGIYSKRIVFK